MKSKKILLMFSLCFCVFLFGACNGKADPENENISSASSVLSDSSVEKDVEDSSKEKVVITPEPFKEENKNDNKTNAKTIDGNEKSESAENKSTTENKSTSENKSMTETPVKPELIKALGYVLEVDDNLMYLDLENTEGRTYPGEGEDRAVVFDIGSAQIDAPRGVRTGITADVTYYIEDGKNIAMEVKSDGDEKEPIVSGSEF